MEHPLKIWRSSLPFGSKTLAHCANRLGVTAGQLSRFERGLRPVPIHKLPLFEKETGIPREVLRPDVFEAAKMAG